MKATTTFKIALRALRRNIMRAILTMLGVSGKVRKVPLMRVEHNGVYAAVASQGGAPEHPKWYANLRKNPVIDLQDDTTTWTARAREIDGAEREEWWQRCVEAYPPYAEYQEKTDRVIPVLLLEPHPEDDAQSPSHQR